MKSQIFTDLIEIARGRYGIDVRMSRSRKREFVDIRCAVANCMKRAYSISISDIARLFDMHHTTILHHLEDHAGRYRYYDDYAKLYDTMVNHVLSKSELISLDKMQALMESAFAV